MNAEQLAGILGREEMPPPYEEPLAILSGKRIVVTGAGGSIGQHLVPVLLQNSSITLATDIADMDVRDEEEVADAIRAFEADYIFHIAGAKHARAGEEDPLEAVLTNTIGTHNVLTHAGDARVVTCSTCKSCNPETAYGASKLIAERMTLNAGGSVARFFNVVETQGNVFEIWDAIPGDEPIPVTVCRRFFISIAEAVGLLLWSAVLPPARYAFAPYGDSRDMRDVARFLYPGRKVVEIPPRRGDRLIEPLFADDEAAYAVDHELWRVESQHDSAIVTAGRDNDSGDRTDRRGSAPVLERPGA